MTQEIRNPFSQNAHCWTDSELQMPPECLCLRTADVCFSRGSWAPAHLSCVSPEAGLAGLISDRPPLPGEPCPAGSGAVVTPGRPSGRAFTVTLTHGSLTPFRAVTSFSQIRMVALALVEKVAHSWHRVLELGQVHQQRPCGADASIQP